MWTELDKFSILGRKFYSVPPLTHCLSFQYSFCTHALMLMILQGSENQPLHKRFTRWQHIADIKHDPRSHLIP